jgi:hypothetical protein
MSFDNSRHKTWTLVGFAETVDAWAARERPPLNVVLAVRDWVPTLAFDPRRGAQREPAIPGLWFRQVPGTHNGHAVVLCSYWVEDARSIVRCDNIAVLSTPV